MAADAVSRVLARFPRHRRIVIAAYAILVPIAAVIASRIPNHSAIDQLIVPGDPASTATREFHAIFPEPKVALLVLESGDPWSPEAIARVDRAVDALDGIPHIRAFSPLAALRRARPGASVEALHQLASGTDFFTRQGLIGPRFMTVIANLEVAGSTQRDEALAAISKALHDAGVEPVRKIGTPYTNAWLERESAAGTGRAFAVFGALLVIMTLLLYRSARALLAIVISLGSAVALAVGAGGVCGFAFTIVSALVPLTVMVTTLATLTYLHLRFIDQPEGVPIAEHQIIALRNKFKPVTASTVAAMMGFAALAVSPIRPIREMGLWTALGLALAWVVAFTLFPALQLALKTPTGRRVAVRSGLYDRAARAIPVVTYRHRRGLVAAALVGCLAGAVALSGMTVEVDALASIDPASSVARDLVWYRDHAKSAGVARVWIQLPRGTATEPEVLRGIDRFETALEAVPNVIGVIGPTTPLRLRNYFAGRGATLPADREELDRQLADVEQLLLSEADLRAFIDVRGLSDVQLTVLVRTGGAAGYAEIEKVARSIWDSLRTTVPDLAEARMHIVGETMLEAKVGASIVPTLAESLVITVVLIMGVFFVVSRSPVERLLAMIPSAFALLVTFFGLRVLGGTLNIATILIATTVLGTTENDQLHFFHHMHELPGAPLEDRLRHALRVSGRAIGFATIIHATGFLALATSSFPPLRQFGIMTSAAFVLAMIADFTVLPAALWLVSRERYAACTPIDLESPDAGRSRRRRSPDLRRRTT